MNTNVGLLGRKVGMTQIFSEDGNPVPVTVIEAGPCPVLQVKTAARDGYEAIQIGFGEVKERRATKSAVGHAKRAGAAPQRFVREFRLPATGEYQPGQMLTVDLFQVGEQVDVTGTSIGKGFQGGVKRWHWKGGPKTHGSTSHRRPGSIGSTTFPGRVWKGHHLPGHMGDDRVTVQNLTVVAVDKEQGVLLVGGGVPGSDMGYVMIRKALKPKRAKQAPVKSAAAAEKEAKAAKAEKPKGGKGKGS
jgi:large subunit ribosomal protein L3